MLNCEYPINSSDENWRQTGIDQWNDMVESLESPQHVLLERQNMKLSEFPDFQEVKDEMVGDKENSFGNEKRESDREISKK